MTGLLFVVIAAIEVAWLFWLWREEKRRWLRRRAFLAQRLDRKRAAIKERFLERCREIEARKAEILALVHDAVQKEKRRHDHP